MSCTSASLGQMKVSIQLGLMMPWLLPTCPKLQTRKPQKAESHIKQIEMIRQIWKKRSFFRDQTSTKDQEMLLGYALADWGQTTVTPGKKDIHKRETFPFYFIPMETVTTSRVRNHFFFIFFFLIVASVFCLTPASKIWIF